MSYDELGSAKESPIFQSILLTTAERLQELVQKHAPQGVQRNFLLWILQKDNIYRDHYLQITGISKIAELGAYFLEGLVDNHVTQALVPYLSVINTYFYNEVISDNLAIGLIFHSAQDSTWHLRREVLLKFNKIMQQKILGDSASIIDLLEPVSTQIASISSFQQSLVPEEMRQLALEYQKQYPESSMQELEHGLFTYLVLNIKSCLDVDRSISDHPIYPLLTKGFCDRYASINKLLQPDNHLNSELLIEYGTKTILVGPSLLYLIAVLDKIKPNSNLLDIMRNGALQNALESAACIVRLLNDIGTQLLALTESNRVEMQKKILQLYQEEQEKEPNLDFFTHLEKISLTDQFYYLLARIRKDIKHREFNICLDSTRNASNTHEAFSVFFENIQYYSELYKKQSTHLTLMLDEISQSLQDELPSQLILKMVKFHEKLYENEFEHHRGDFATKL